MTITVDAQGALARIGIVSNAMKRTGMRKLKPFAVKQLQLGIAAAFAGRKNPATGTPWAPRRSGGAWPMLNRTGGLKGALGATGQVYATSMRARVLVSDSRSGNSSYHAIAGALFYGRKKVAPSGRGGLMPARRFAGVSKAGTEYLKTQMSRLIRKG